MYRCGAETATTERPCGGRVPAYGARCPRHREQPRADVIDLAAYRRARTDATPAAAALLRSLAAHRNAERRNTEQRDLARRRAHRTAR